MLQYIRERAQGVIAWLIVGAIILTFALFGINQYFSGGGDTSVAKVDGTEISQGQLQVATMQQRQRLEQMFGGKLPDMFSEEMIKSQVLQQLIEQEMLIQTARNNGMRIGDNALAQTIVGIEAFQEDGKFSNTRYQQLLRAQGMMPGTFEQRVRRDLLAAQFTGGVRDTAFTTVNAVDEYLRLQQQQRSIAYLTVPTDKFKNAVKVSEEEISSYYQKHATEYIQPERVKVDYLELNIEDIAGSIEVDESAVQERYEARKINYTTPEQRKARHILIQVPADSDEEIVAAAKQKAEDLLARVRKGEDFAELAKTESDDPGSAPQGGDLGFFGRGIMDPAFEEAAFALGKGEISELVHSSFGFHIIKLDDVRGGTVKSFDEVKDEIRKEIQKERAEQQYYDMAEQLANLTYEHPESLTMAAEQLSLSVKTSPFFTRNGGPGIASEPKVVEAAFGDEVLARGNNSETIELGSNHLVVLHLNEHQPEIQRPLEEVKGGIVSKIKSDKAKAQAVELATAVSERVRAGEKPAELAKTLDIKWSARQEIRRDASDIDRTIAAEVFRLPKPADGQEQVKRMALPSGDQAVVILYDVEEGKPAKVGDKEREQARNKLQQAVSTADLAGVVETLRSGTDITIRQ